MNQLVPFHSSTLPALVATAGERASMRFLERFQVGRFHISVIGVVWGAQAERDPALISRHPAELRRWWEAGRLEPLGFSVARGQPGTDGAAVAPVRR